MTNIMIVGEGWSEKDEEAKAPFQGSSGWLLRSCLSQIGIDIADCYLTNVFNRRVGDIKNLLGSKPEAIPGYPSLVKGKFLRREFQPELLRLYSEIRSINPNLIIALGATAAWALTHSSGIRAIRGATLPTHPLLTPHLGRVYKVLPTYNPAAVNREWSLRPIFLSDLNKGKSASLDSAVSRPPRSILISPTLDDIKAYDHEFIQPASILSADIETVGNQITCIGFAPDPGNCIVIPFHSKAQSDGNYWRTLAEELRAWHFVRKWLAEKPTLFQNGLYDISFLWRSYGIPVPLAAEDTMLLHHAWQPEMEKGLGFLATLYTDEASWKFMRKGTRHD